MPDILQALQHAAAIGAASADNEDYLCPVSVGEATAAANEIIQLRAERETRGEKCQACLRAMVGNSRAALATSRADVMEECAKVLDSRHRTHGSHETAFGHGWNAALALGAAAVRELKDKADV